MGVLTINRLNVSFLAVQIEVLWGWTIGEGFRPEEGEFVFNIHSTVNVKDVKYIEQHQLAVAFNGKARVEECPVYPINDKWMTC